MPGTERIRARYVDRLRTNPLKRNAYGVCGHGRLRRAWPFKKGVNEGRSSRYRTMANKAQRCGGFAADNIILMSHKPSQDGDVCIANLGGISSHPLGHLYGRSCSRVPAAPPPDSVGGPTHIGFTAHHRHMACPYRGTTGCRPRYKCHDQSKHAHSEYHAHHPRFIVPRLPTMLMPWADTGSCCIVLRAMSLYGFGSNAVEAPSTAANGIRQRL
ncbi:hypothetical protein FHS47_001119 [Lutibacter sp. SG786]|nr:hypothetical protein [Luteibacter sp. SG786]